MSGQDQLQTECAWAEQLAAKLVELAAKEGAAAADATVGAGSSLSAKARDGEVESVTRSASRAAGVRVIVDGKLGFSTAAAAPSSDEDAAELVRAAVSLARISSQSEHNVIPNASAPTGDDLAQRVKALQLWDGDVAGADADWAAERAVLMERVVTSTDGVSTVREVAAATSRNVFGLASSNGFRGAYGGTSAQLYASGVVEDGDKKQVDGWWTAARGFGGLDDAESVAKEAAERALRRKGARKVKSCSAPVIFDTSMARTFFGALLSAMNGDAISRDASFLRGKKGEVVLRSGLTLREDPFLPGGLGSRPFDGEGLACRPGELIDAEGRLLTWLHDARSAHRLGEEPTGHAARGASGLPGASVTNVLVEGGEGDLDSIIAATDRGLLVTQLLGHSPDMITGEYSRGASGFWIEDGAIVHPVEEVTIAGDMVDMARGLDLVGDDLDRRSSVQVPTIRFAELAISGS